MKIIEALKRSKDLIRKAEDIRGKIALYCADLDNENPAYETVEKQKEQINSWLQMHSDILKEIANLRMAYQRTNLAVEVPIEIGGKIVVKSIAYWIHRRKDLAAFEAAAWANLTDRKLRPGNYKKDGSETFFVANIRKYYDQKTRDERVELYTAEKSQIDAALEIANATHDIIEPTNGDKNQ